VESGSGCRVSTAVCQQRFWTAASGTHRYPLSTEVASQAEAARRTQAVARRSEKLLAQISRHRHIQRAAM